MANRGSNTNGAQFFITYGEHKHLNNQYTVFARYVRVYSVRAAAGEPPYHHPKA